MAYRLAVAASVVLVSAPLTLALPSSVVPVLAAEADTPDIVTVMAFPNDGAMATVPLGGRYSMVRIAASVTSSGDVYAVTVDTSDVPDDVLSDSGVVNLQVQVTDPDTGGIDTTGLSLQAASPGAESAKSSVEPPSRPGFRTFKVLLDPTSPDRKASRKPAKAASALAEDGGYRSVPPQFGPDQVAAWDEWASDVAGPDPDDKTGAASCTRLATAKVWTTIGSTYPVGGDKSWLTFSSSESTSTGVAYSYDGGASFSQDGTKSTTDEWGEDFAKHSNMRTYRIQIKYGLSHCYNIITGYGWYQSYPITQTGGTDAYALSGDRPDWDNCAPVIDGNWWRGAIRGNDYSNSEGVKISDQLGIYLSSSHRYSSGTRSYYAIPSVGRRICGNDDVPSKAGKIMERLR
jgi:hypothetical protein